MFAKFGLLFLVGIATNWVDSYPTPDRFDIEDIYPDLSLVQNVWLVGALPCRVTGAYAITTALEIANFIATGISKEFSVQEIVDCHFGGCNERRYSDYAEWLAVNDRLAPADRYTKYRSQSYTCRAATSPDALIYIRVIGFRNIDAADFQTEFMT